MKLFIPIIVITSLKISCADILIEDTLNTTSTSGIEGFWFNCEFNYSDTDFGFLMTMVISLQKMVVSIP